MSLQPAMDPSRPRPAPSPADDPRSALCAGTLGLFLGLALLKFGNPVILDRLIDMPRTAEEWRVFAWPIRVAHLLSLPVLLAGAAFVAGCPDRRPRLPGWLLGLLGAWILWQCAAFPGATDPAAAGTILAHFAGCVLAFGLGHWALARVGQPRVFWTCLVLAFLAVLAFAAEQRFGGLEATRKMILAQPDAAKLPAEYLARIQSNRVFSTLVYPNALAGAILLLLPAATVLAARATRAFGPAPSNLATAAMLLSGGAVLVWSGSKAGWLIAMGLILTVLFHSPVAVRWKWVLAAALLVGGLTAFTVVFREKLARGPTSVSARMDYWSAAWTGFRERPWLGQGPGGFKRVYARVKRPESEMAQLAHNDYLQQATDSGLPGFVAYAGFVAGALGLLYRRRPRRVVDLSADSGQLEIAVLLGLLGWFTHGLVEFGLYIPATAWCAFTLLGWALAQASPRPPNA